jgi:hypothetical protein
MTIKSLLKSKRKIKKFLLNKFILRITHSHSASTFTVYFIIITAINTWNFNYNYYSKENFVHITSDILFLL